MAKCYVAKSGKRYFPILRNGQEQIRDGEVAVVGERNGKWFGPIRNVRISNMRIEDHPKPVGHK